MAEETTNVNENVLADIELEVTRLRRVMALTGLAEVLVAREKVPGTDLYAELTRIVKILSGFLDA